MSTVQCKRNIKADNSKQFVCSRSCLTKGLLLNPQKVFDLELLVSKHSNKYYGWATHGMRLTFSLKAASANTNKLFKTNISNSLAM